MNIKITDQSDIIEHYGVRNQLGIAMEECAELIQAISKMNRTNGDAEEYMKSKLHLEEEIADVIEYDKKTKKWNCGDGDVIAWISLQQPYKVGSDK